MLFHRHESLEPIGHRRALDPQQLLGQIGDHLVCRLECRLVLAEEHRAIEPEVIVVAPIERIEILRPPLLEEFAVAGDGPAVPVAYILVVAAQHVDVGRHVHEVARIGNDGAQRIGGASARAADTATSP